MRIDWLRRVAYRTVAKHDLDPTLTRSWITPLLTAPQVRRDTACFLKAIDHHDTMRAAEKLRDFHRPVLLLWPSRLPYFPFEHAQRWLQVLPDARLVEVPDSHAFVCHDQPEFAADRIVRFIDHDVPEAQT